MSGSPASKLLTTTSCLLAGALAAAPSTSQAPARSPGTRQLPVIDFELVWDSGTTLSNVLTVEAGDANLNGRFDFAGTHFDPNVIYLFQANGRGGYNESWNSTGNFPPATYKTLAFGDTDGDGRGEIFGGEASLQRSVMLFEEAPGGFDFLHADINEADVSFNNMRLETVLLGDTDKDGRTEVVVIAGESSRGLVAIWEHTGALGDNTYSRVFELTTTGSLNGASLGDSDNDGWPEIVLDGLGGAGEIHRLEFDPGAGTWVQRTFQSNVTGLRVPLVGDFDQDGDREIAYGPGSRVVIFENTGPNAYSPRYMSPQTLDGGILSLASVSFRDLGTAAIAAGSLGGEVGVWFYDAAEDDFELGFFRRNFGGPVRGLALGNDVSNGAEVLLAAVSPPVDQVQVFRRVAPMPPDPCGDPAAFCLNRSRFLIEVRWRDFEGNRGRARAAPFRSDDSGLFWFFDADNWEMLIKVLDGCGVNGRFWVFAAATTDVEYTLRVTDTVTGAVRRYFNPLGNAADALTDTDAFDTCDAP